MSTDIFNILSNSLTSRRVGETIRKIGYRWTERGARRQRAEIAAWCAAHATDGASWAKRLDPALWDEAQSFAAAQKSWADARMAEAKVKLGGGGAYDFLYFLTRLVRPESIVETGVAAGFSSRAFLSAIERNGSGTLYSSDFPYLRLPQPEKYVGLVVEPELRSRWKLYLEGDRANLKVISSELKKIDLFHYDSDKSYGGRTFALNQLSPFFHPETLILFDDIQDNWHFRDYAAGKALLVIEFGGKWVGVSGGPARLYG